MELFSNDIIEKSVDFTNKFFENNYFRNVVLVVSAVLIGYALQPVPKWLNHLFNTSLTLRFLILFITGYVAVYPVNKNDKYIIFWIGLYSILLLLGFHLLRKMDDYLVFWKEPQQEQKEEQKEEQGQKKIENFKNLPNLNKM